MEGRCMTPREQANLFSREAIQAIRYDFNKKRLEGSIKLLLDKRYVEAEVRVGVILCNNHFGKNYSWVFGNSRVIKKAVDKKDFIIPLTQTMETVLNEEWAINDPILTILDRSDPEGDRKYNIYQEK